MSFYIFGAIAVGFFAFPMVLYYLVDSGIRLSEIETLNIVCASTLSIVAGVILGILWFMVLPITVLYSFYRLFKVVFNGSEKK